MKNNRRKIGIATTSILFLIVAIFINYSVRAAANVSAGRLYEQGMKLYEEQKYSDAYFNFQKISRLSNLYQLSLLKQYQCAVYLADKKSAHAKISELSRLAKNQYIRPLAMYNEASLANELRQVSDGKTFRKFRRINSLFPNTDFGIASAYKMARLAQTRNPKIAKDKYLEYIKLAPTGKFITYALDNVLKVKQITLTQDEYALIGDANLLNGRYKEALNAYRNASFSKVWYNVSRCYRGLGAIAQEKNMIIKGIELSSSETDEKDIDAAIERLIVIQGWQKDRAYEYLKTRYDETYAYPTILYKMAENVQKKENAIKYYKIIKDDYPASLWASNSLWEVFWYNYNLEQYDTCFELAKIHKELYSKSQDAPRIMYWSAKIYSKKHRSTKAKELYNKVIENYPMSYYAFLSAKQLKISKSKKRLLRKSITDYDISNIDKFLFKDKILSELIKRKDYKTIDELKISNEFIKSRTAYEKKQYPTAINYAKKEINKAITTKEYENGDLEAKINYADYGLKLSYPILYEKEINKYAKEVKQSPYLFLSLIREESHFDKNAKSPAGAVGLSQIMPATAKFIEKREITKQALLDPDENIRIGLNYFNYLVDYYQNNEYLAILAYNAGPGSIDKWTVNPEIANEDIDAFVENVPYLETKNYIKKILSSYWSYLNIYSHANR